MDFQVDQYTDLSVLLFAQLITEWAVGFPIFNGGAVEK